MTNSEETGLSAKSNLVLIGEKGKEQLAFNGNIVNLADLKANSFVFGKKYQQSCSMCSPTQNVQWHEVTITCKNVAGPIWLCPKCSFAYIHEARGAAIWSRLLTTLRPSAS